jgi:hypothetical protein
VPNNTGTNGTNTGTSIFVDNGIVQIGATGAAGATNGTTTGRIALGSSNTTTAGPISLLLTTAGVNLANPIDSRFFAAVSSSKVIGGSNATGTVTYSGGITLHDNTSLVATNGGTVVFSGVIATGTNDTPYTGETANAVAPAGGFGTGPGVIINSGASSTGIVEYDNAMSYNGDTVVNSGTLQFNGSGSLLNSTIRLGALGPATLNMISPTGSTLNVTLNVRTANSVVSASNTSGTSTLGGHFALDANATVQEASSTGTLAITQARAGGAGTTTGTDIKGFTLTLSPVGTLNVSGDIYNSTGSGNVVLNGSGTSTFSGTNTYLGTTAVSGGGKLFINGNQSTATGAVTVTGSGTTLGGSGTTGGSVGIASGNNLSPGATGVGSTATLHTGALTLSSGSFYNVDLNGSTAGTGYDQVIATSLSIAGANLAISVGGPLNIGDQLFIADNTGASAVTGTFSGLAQGATVTSGMDAFTISYIANGGDGTNGNDISLTVIAVPEAGTWVAGALVFASLLLTQRKRLTHLVRREGSSVAS